MALVLVVVLLLVAAVGVVEGAALVVGLAVVGVLVFVFDVGLAVAAVVADVVEVLLLLGASVAAAGCRVMGVKEMHPSTNVIRAKKFFGCIIYLSRILIVRGVVLVWCCKTVRPALRHSLLLVRH